jgi:hypothetical protein
MNYANEAIETMGLLPLPAGYIASDFERSIADKSREELIQIAARLQRENLDLRVKSCRELGLAYGVIPYLEALG